MNAPIQFDRSFASHEKAKYWSEKNGKVKPKDVYKGSCKKYWFDCDKCPHSFDSSLSNVTGNGRWCPYCAVPSKKLCETLDCNNCFTRTFASHEKSKYWSDKNGDVKPWDVFKSSSKKYWFDCHKCKHSFNSVLSSISNGVWCPYCAIPVKQLCDKSTCDFCFTKSFASHENAKYWSDKNGDVNPRDVFKSSNKKYWFHCDTCKHSFYSALSNVTAGYWCPYCSHTKLCEKQECIHCFDKSFASHEKAKCWSEKNGHDKPRDIFNRSGTKYWFNCDTCKHSFYSALSNVTAGYWCPYCSHTKLCDNSDCGFCYKNSFASHKNAKYWSEKNDDVKPRDIFNRSGTKYWFNCNKCSREFDKILGDIYHGGWCPYCKNKTETKLFDALKPLYPTLITQFKQEWCKNKSCLPFDFCIPEHKIIIELDGRQHFKQVSNWKCPEETFENDLFKETCANDNGYSVIRILQEDVLYDRYDWFDRIQTEIENIIKDDTIIHNVYMAENGEYDAYITE